MKPYDDCIYCGGKVAEKLQAVDYRYHDQLFIMENVPVGVCAQCGEKYFKAEIAKKLEKLASTSTNKVKTLAVPVINIAA